MNSTFLIGTFVSLVKSDLAPVSNSHDMKTPGAEYDQLIVITH